jgi:hypothetical protein
VKLDRWMPEGWSGTADWVFWNADLGGFVLGDLETIKGDGITWIEKDGAKSEQALAAQRLLARLVRRQPSLSPE